MIQTHSLSSHQLVAQVGETDQQFLTNPTPALAKTRAQLRVALSKISRQRQEQLYFLTEAAALLEIALMNVSNLDEHIALSAALGETYLQFYHVTKEQRYLIINKQVIKPLSHHNSTEILLGLAKLSAVEQHPSLVKHWLTRLLEIEDADIQALWQVEELKPYHQESWFKQLLQQKMH